MYLSPDDCWHQFETPSLGCSEGNFMQCKQRDSMAGKTALLGISSIVLQHSCGCGTTLGPSPSALVKHILPVSAPARKTQPPVFGEKCVEKEGSWLMWTEVPPLVPDWFVLMQMRTPNCCSLIGPKSTIQINLSCAALTGWEKPQSHWLKEDSRKPL